MRVESEVPAQAGKVIYFTSVYLLITGALYEIGYWSRFSINIFEYIGLTDVVKQAIIPVGPAFVNLIFVIILQLTAPLVPNLPSGGGRDSNVGRSLRKYLKLIGIAYLALTLAVFYFEPPNAWLLLPYLIALPAAFALGEVPIFREFCPEKFSNAVSFLLVMLPLTAYGTGRLASDDLLSGRKFNYVIETTVSFPTSTFDVMKAQRYIGRAGDENFYFDPETSFVSISKIEDGKSLTLGTHPKRNLPKGQ